MNHDVKEIIAQIPDWINANNIQIEPLEGLTNTNYVVTVDGERFVLRVSGKNTDFLGIDRKFEMEALLSACQSELGPQIVHFLLPEGHLVTRYIDGQHLKLEDYREKENIQRITGAVKRLHELPPVNAVFSPFQRIEKFTDQARTMKVPFPNDFNKMLKKMTEIEQNQAKDTSPWLKFCHNDLFCVNVLDDGDIWFIDWEFAGMGDIYFDLATLTYAYDFPETLSPEHQEYMLACYFGEVIDKNRARLQGMRYMLLLFSAMWSLLQKGLQNEGYVREIVGFDFMDYANQTFDAIRKNYRL